MRLSVVMPAYNEAQNIEKMVRRCFDVISGLTSDVEVVVTNDGSKDRTGDILYALQTEYPGLKVETNHPNQGYGAALARAIRASTGDIVITIDSDGQFDISDVSEMLPRFTESTVVLSGYRKTKQDAWIKVIGDRIMNRLIRLMFGVSYRDTNCALKLLNGPVIRKMQFEASGFQLPTEIVLKAHALGLIVTETAVNHAVRSGGRSSLAPFRTAWQMLIFLIYLKRKIALYKQGVIRSL
ncbi:glycosyltransferase family 2 protein [bacterium]|nr:glycosyltransferase family 2 protein [candidate division CSSED10-310 bacterium]